ncbi:exodeoxyribonuclease V subunit gamma [Echinimonas agarilytica]|uniref:RecBCD enzyme subunit RecC n=1 Tax=Echinimonas agarilytica TaxID=1215918 RepID=A0AA42B8T1_9GAMM|nr:exodeoxyribonuclease V subunit gamma [Echinimonas agarilytica]MCM2681232.1 exodeoxyribonuclease V subunit gamma [Echinimonas agarilytica]
MLHIYQSNLTEVLLHGLSHVLRQPLPTMSVLDPEHILVQNPDMAQWLKIELAQAHGIAANVEFPLPSSFMWRVFHALFKSQIPEQTPFSKDQITWQIMQLLPGFQHHPSFTWTHRYLDQLGTPEGQLKLYQLSGSIADIFDQYLMYRPDWISHWENGEGLDKIPEAHHWQALLWQAVANAIVDNTGCKLHRGRLLQETIETLNASEPLDVSSLPKRIVIFGISAMPEQTLLLINGLGRHIDVHWFQLNPCREFWLDIIDPKTKAKLAADAKYIHLDELEESRYFLVGNPLLAAMGTLGREHLSLMYEQLDADLIEEYPDYPSTGALCALQTEILNLHCRQQFEALNVEQLGSNLGKVPLKLSELNNVQFHSCYSPMREVEALKDQLLHLFDQDPMLTPNDVLIMMPDVGLYAPFIHTVLAAKQNDVFIPYSINDLSAIQESPLLDSLIRLLSLPDSRFQASEIMSILEIPAVLKRFEMDEVDLESVKHWLNEVGVRWGRDGKQRADLGVGQYSQNSWQFGIDRLMAGYAMHPDQGMFDQSLPYIEVEGSNGELVGKLMMFVDALDVTREALQQPRSIGDWTATIAALMARFYQADSDEQIMLQRASRSLERFHQGAQTAQFEDEVSALVVRDYLKQNLTAAQSGKRFRAGALNFCTLMPMRTIPFKVVCLLGMNDGMFPRVATPVSFDLMQNERRRGDRSRRLDDRYLFLEALLSARQHLHISWVGRDIRDDSELPPSILVSELRDYMAESWCIDGHQEFPPETAANTLLREMTTHHALQPFHPRYFDETNPQSYAVQWMKALQHKPSAAPFCEQPLFVEASDNVIEMRQLEAMLTKPCEVFLQRQLGVYFDELSDTDEDNEPFELDALERWYLKDRALSAGLTGDAKNTQRFMQNYRHSGALPVAEAGEMELTNASESIASLLVLLPQLNANLNNFEELRIHVGLQLVAGSVPAGHAGKYCYVKPGSLKGRDVMRAWIRHVAVCATQSHACETWALDSERGRIFMPIAKDEAKQLLADYVGIYQQGLSRPLPFFVESAHRFMQHQEAAKDAEEIKASVLGNWIANFGHIPGEGENAYIQRCYPNLDDVWPEFTELSQRLLGPIAHYSETFKVRGRYTTSPKHAQLVERLEAGQ